MFGIPSVKIVPRVEEEVDFSACVDFAESEGIFCCVL